MGDVCRKAWGFPSIRSDVRNAFGKLPSAVGMLHPVIPGGEQRLEVLARLPGEEADLRVRTRVVGGIETGMIENTDWRHLGVERRLYSPGQCFRPADGVLHIEEACDGLVWLCSTSDTSCWRSVPPPPPRPSIRQQPMTSSASSTSISLSSFIGTW